MNFDLDFKYKITTDLYSIKCLFEEYFLNSHSDIYMFLENFDDLEDIFKDLHSKIRDFCNHNKIFIVLKNYDKYNDVKTDFKRNIFNYSNIYLRGVKNYFEEDDYQQYGIEPIQSFVHSANSYIYCDDFYWINTCPNIGEDFNQFEGFASNCKKILKRIPKTNLSLLKQSKPLNEREIEGIDYFKHDENDEPFKHVGCLFYIIPIMILISLTFLLI